jgi:hypothetical protein
MKMTCDACHTNFDAPNELADSAACPCCEHVNRPKARTEKLSPTTMSPEVTADVDDPPIKTLVFPAQETIGKTEAAEAAIQEAEEIEAPSPVPDTEEAEITRPKSRRPAAATVLRLTVVEGGKPPCRYVLEKPRIVLGRGKCDVKVHDPEVSREHCAIETRDGVAMLRDLKSANGTVLNGHLVNEHALKHGDQITIGTTLVKVFLAKAA